MATTPIHQTTLTLTILSPDPIPVGIPFSDLAYEVEQGEWTGQLALSSHEVLTTPQAIHQALADLGADEGFFDFGDDQEDDD
jgi:hypothetical protein